MTGLDQPTVLDAALKQGTSIGTPAARSIAAAYLSQGAWSPAPEQLVFTGNGRQSIAATVPAGGRCGVAAAARREIALTPSATFAVTPGHAPNAVRLALAALAMEQLDAALRTLAGMLNAREDDVYGTE